MNKLWGSRFKTTTDPQADRFTSSLSYDKRLLPYDCLGSIAHAKMLGKCGIISKKDARVIVGALKKIWIEIESGKFKFDKDAEDIHTLLMMVLKKQIGQTADKLHTARSRNDQVVLDMKLYCRDEINRLIKYLKSLQKSILKFSIANNNVIIPAYTHLQSAQVVLLSHHMLAYIEMLERDISRLIDTQQRLNTLPLGSCALSGTSLPIDRNYVAKELGFDSVMANSMDAVSDRDFIVDIIHNVALISTHLSRMAEDLILWATDEFHFIAIDWAYCTGSSIMPHKKNPDILELIRGSQAKIQGDIICILTLLKGLPLTYNRDLQLDKPPLFDAVDTTKDILLIMAKVIDSLKVNTQAVKKKIQNEALFSVDIMEYLIAKGLSYRDAHDTVGRMVKECLDKGKNISELSLPQLKHYSKKFDDGIKDILNPIASIRIKKSFGSTNPSRVQKQLKGWMKKLHARL